MTISQAKCANVADGRVQKGTEIQSGYIMGTKWNNLTCSIFRI